MQVLVETTEDLKKRATITLFSDDIEKAIKDKVVKTAKTAKMDGFRKGKVPINLIEQRYGESIQQDILIDFMQDHFSKTILQEKLNLAGRPQYLPGKYIKNENYTYSVEFEVYPEIKLKDLELIEVEKPIVSLNDDDIDKMLEKLRHQKKTWQEIPDLPAEMGDRVTFDFTGSVDGEKFEGGTASDFVMNLGEGNMIPGFEEGIVGHKMSEEFNITLTFPDEYHSESLKGKESQFLIHLKKIEKFQLPEINEEFIKNFDLPEESSIEALRAEIRKNMQRELTKAIRKRIKEQTITSLCDLNKTKVPLSLIEEEIDALRTKAASYSDKKDIIKELPRSVFAEKAESRVLVGLLLTEVIDQNKLTVDENKVQVFLEEIAEAYENPKETIEFYKNNKKLMNNIYNLALEEEAIQVLLKNAKITEKPISFSEFMKQIHETDTAND
ncbi:trigger factor [Candidatus Hamiltonella defensa]|uniref:Trigger factor n=1 Tax=Candidatus Williamhamiltonella defendens TaxID=138072 RepID=A0A2D3TBX4_9ENTR|nr:trigger factor [Candidatus Hamiltonella defensa]ASV33691.1 trigger factor [Candidatus Hamiltonella defensa]ATW33307.1 trigger factor [Candidatus Hamiltonella defensa]AWK16648.1 trigger factor [Candidatus Hamiltonella defensa]AYB49522.1 trigger factor [Candidatus Hamiltonella defensa]MBK4360798.1 trigger factor [Candidatus Hamiltonella defensa]